MFGSTPRNDRLYCYCDCYYDYYYDDDADIAKEGGVQVRVERLSGGDLRVIASRCEVEEGTMTKEMSEGVIIDSLRKAVTAWRKEQAS